MEIRVVDTISVICGGLYCHSCSLSESPVTLVVTPKGCGLHLTGGRGGRIVTESRIPVGPAVNDYLSQIRVAIQAERNGDHCYGLQMNCCKILQSQIWISTQSTK